MASTFLAISRGSVTLRRTGRAGSCFVVAIAPVYTILVHRAPH
jgi:hypothetical protein